MDPMDNLKPTRAASWLSLLTSGGTLICCALPAAFVALGAGAALSGLIALVPQLVWFSEHKAGIFIAAAAMLVVSGALQWQSRKLPCPVDPTLAEACMASRTRSLWIYLIAVGTFGVGGFFAFIAPYWL